MAVLGNLTSDFMVQEEIFADRTYQVKNDKIQGFFDGREALRQSIEKILRTERYQCPLYSFRYGIEFERLIGKDQEYVRSEMKRMITEALKRDSRVLDVSGFSFDFSGDGVVCEFMVNSIYGSFTLKGGVTI